MGMKKKEREREKKKLKKRCTNEVNYVRINLILNDRAGL